LKTILVRAMSDVEAQVLLEQGKREAMQRALHSMLGQGLWTPTDTPRNDESFPSSLRVWAARQGKNVAVWMTRSPKASDEPLGDTQALRTLKSTLSVVVEEW